MIQYGEVSALAWKVEVGGDVGRGADGVTENGEAICGEAAGAESGCCPLEVVEEVWWEVSLVIE